MITIAITSTDNRASKTEILKILQTSTLADYEVLLNMRLIPDEPVKEAKLKLEYLQLPDHIGKLEIVKEAKELLNISLADAKELCDILQNIATGRGKVYAYIIHDLAITYQNNYVTLCNILKLSPTMLEPDQEILKKLQKAEGPITWKIV